MKILNISKEVGLFLLKLSYSTLEHFFSTGKKLEVPESELLNGELKEKRGTFVTLQKHGELRGCIGHIEPIQTIYQDIVENTLSAAFEDPRFEPLTQDELKDIDIEISVLTNPEKLNYSSVDELLAKLRPNIDGVIIKKGRRGATYLPQVWEDLSDKNEFLSSLCLKAGLEEGEWRKGKLEVKTYQAEHISHNT
jgi:hypothetical protein